MAWKKFSEGVAIGAGLAVGLVAVAVVLQIISPSTFQSGRAALFSR